MREIISLCYVLREQINATTFYANEYQQEKSNLRLSLMRNCVDEQTKSITVL